MGQPIQWTVCINAIYLLEIFCEVFAFLAHMCKVYIYFIIHCWYHESRVNVSRILLNLVSNLSYLNILQPHILQPHILHKVFNEAFVLFNDTVVTGCAGHPWLHYFYQCSTALFCQLVLWGRNIWVIHYYK